MISKEIWLKVKCSKWQCLEIDNMKLRRTWSKINLEKGDTWS